MTYNGLVEPEQLAVLSKVLDEHCLSKGISDELGRKVIATRLVFFLMKGINTAEELRSALNDKSRQERSHSNQRAARL